MQLNHSDLKVHIKGGIKHVSMTRKCHNRSPRHHDHQSENIGSIWESSLRCIFGIVGLLCMKKLHSISRNWRKEKNYCSVWVLKRFINSFISDILLKKITSFTTVWVAVITLVIVLAWFLWRQRHVIKVDPRCTSEVWFHGIPRNLLKQFKLHNHEKKTQNTNSHKTERTQQLIYFSARWLHNWEGRKNDTIIQVVDTNPHTQ